MCTRAGTTDKGDEIGVKHERETGLTFRHGIGTVLSVENFHGNNRIERHM